MSLKVCIESFHSLLKKEEVYHKSYKDSEDVYNNIFEYIEFWYHRRRTHSSLGYMIPAAVHTEDAAKSRTFGVHFIDLRPNTILLLKSLQ